MNSFCNQANLNNIWALKKFSVLDGNFSFTKKIIVVMMQVKQTHRQKAPSSAILKLVRTAASENLSQVNIKQTKSVAIELIENEQFPIYMK